MLDAVSSPFSAGLMEEARHLGDLRAVLWPMVAMDRSGLWTYGRALASTLAPVLGRRLHLGLSPSQRDTPELQQASRIDVADNASWMRWIAEADRPGHLIHFPVGNRRLFPLRHAYKIATVHDIAEYLYPERFGWFHTVNVKLLLAPILHQMDAIIAVSEQTRRDLIDYVRIPSSRIVTVHNGVDTSVFRPIAAPRVEAVKAHYELSRPYWLYVSRIEHPVKNHVTLLEAYARLRDAGEELPQLVFVGAPDIRADVVMQRIETLRLERDVRCLGYLPFSDLPPIIAGARASLFPSLYEGFGLPLLESLACETPVICSDIRVFDEFVPADAMRFSPKDPASLAWCLRQDLARPRQKATLPPAFTWEACAQKTLAVYRQVIG